MSPADPTRLFVYGSLRRGGRYHELLGAALPGRRVRTLPDFELVDLGPYPAMVRGGSTAIVGELYEVDAETLARLDELEGHPLLYRRGGIVLQGGERAETYLYPRERSLGWPRLPGGDWMAR